MVAPDYAGLGVARHADGKPIRRTWLSSAQGNDLIYAVQAAQEAFPELSDRFVLAGHSQGGYAAWAAARRLAYMPVQGYLGTIAASPPTNLSLENELLPPGIAANALAIATGIDETYTSFRSSDWLTDKGMRYLELIREVGACNSALAQLVLQPGLVKPDVDTSPYFRNYAHLMANSGRLFAGPMLVLQGTADSVVPAASIESAVNKTCENYPHGKLEFATFKDVEHVPVMYVSQRIWLDWIGDRFAGKEAAAPCSRREYHPTRMEESYQKQLGFYLEFATQPYLVA